MSVRFLPLSELNELAKDILVRELGIVDTIRFLNQFRAGGGNYTEERREIYRDMTADEIIREIKALRKTQRVTACSSQK